MDGQVETALAQRLLKGEPESFDRFVQYFRSRIFNYSWLMCRQREDAEEVAQETFLRAYQTFPELREPEHIRQWIFRIAKNACLTMRRRSLFAPPPAQEISLDGGGPEHGAAPLQIADRSRLPDSLIQQAELRRELHHAIANLPDLHRGVILLRDVKGLSTQETARVLGISEDVVRTRLRRARLALRQRLEN